MKKQVNKNQDPNLNEKEALRDILKRTKRVTHYIVSGTEKDMKSFLYNGDYSKEDIENAILVQSKLGELCRYFNEIVVEKKKFNQRKLMEAIGDSLIIYKMKDDISKLKKEIAELKGKKDGRN